MAHVGSPNTFFAGQAGPYPIRVTVRLPGVIPGRAQVAVRIVGAAPGTIRHVGIRAALWTVGIEGAPPADTGVAVAGDPELYSAELWFMAPSSYRLFVTVDGDRGEGTAIVPAVALATAQRTMGTGLGGLLAGLGLFLAVGMLTIVAAAARESTLSPGTEIDARAVRRGWRAVLIAAVIVAAAAWGGHWWWAAEASIYGRFVLYRPFATDASSRIEQGRAVLTLRIQDERWPERPNPNSRWNALLPDHGKLMHMFLIREDGMNAFAHVHPVARTPSAHEFDVTLPPLPAGRYRVYGDLVHESGYAQTLVATADVPALASHADGGSGADPDDSSFAGTAIDVAANAKFVMPDGSAIVWRQPAGRLVANVESLLAFSAEDAAGAPLTPQPYMGMLGHAAVASDDGTVFAHLHPAGSISMAALQRFTKKDAAAPAPSHDMSSMSSGHASGTDGPSHLSIPYAFPKAGSYRVFVQMKHHDRIHTAAFRVEVAPAG
jgi:hypothetical protein